MFEIEFKFKVKDKDKMYDMLRNLHCEFSELHQCDHIYVKNGINDFNIPAGENVLRIREQNGVNYITLKQRLNYLEYETVVEDSNAMNNIFIALGYHKLVEVDKYRKETSIKGFNITVDEVERLGCFVEIEKLTENDQDIKNIENDIINFASELGFSKEDIEEEKYDSMILKLNYRQKSE